jgi:hexosaminidase
MEIDSPAHAGNGWQWSKASGYGEMALCVDKGPWRKYCVQPPCGQLNPINTNTYKWLGKIYKDLISAFPKGEAFHMGGDEVNLKIKNPIQLQMLFYMLLKIGCYKLLELYS